MPFITVQGRELYYARQGQGPAVLFCHGAGSNGATWWQQLPVFAKHYTCITIDIRCFGRSVAPASEFSLTQFTGDALAVLDHAGIDQAVVVGQSLGGMIGLRLALHHPQRVRALVACDSTLAVDHPELLEIVRRRLETTGALRIEQRSVGRWFLETQPALAELYSQINHFNPSTLRIPAAEWQAALMAQMGPPHLTPVADLARVACPMLFVVGSEDPLLPASIANQLAAQVPGSEIQIVDQAGHSAYFEQPAVVNAAVLDFLARRLPAA